MGFLDKLQQTAKETLDKGKEKLEDVQADRTADKLLRDLGAWYYAGRTGRDNGEGAVNVERIVAELQAHEAEHGPLGGGDTAGADDPAAAAAESAPATPPPAPTAPTAPATPPPTAPATPPPAPTAPAAPATPPPTAPATPPPAAPVVPPPPPPPPPPVTSGPPPPPPPA